MDEDPQLPTKNVFKHTKDLFLDEWLEQPFDVEMTMPDFPPPYFINTLSIFLNSDLPPKKKRLLVEEDLQEIARSN